MSKVKVIGIGSPYGNDTIGWRLIDKLKQQRDLVTLLPKRIELIESDRPGINLIQMFQGTDFVILIDAILDKDKHGAILRVNKNQLITAHHSVSSHSLDVANAIALAEKLNALPKKLVILGLGIAGEREESIPDESIEKLAATVTCELVNYFISPQLFSYASATDLHRSSPDTHAMPHALSGATR